MLIEFLEAVGPWGWVIFALLLLGIEIIMPSTFLLWPGLAALIVGIITLILGTESSIWPWQVQVLVFLGLSLTVAYLGRQYMRSRNLEGSEQPDLNQRGTQLVGQRARLTVAIENGQGRAKIGDTTWRVSGPDTPEGETVEVVDNESNILIVKKV